MLSAYCIWVEKLPPSQLQYAVVEQESLAIKWAIDELKYYLIGRHFTLVTDHALLQWMAKAKDTNSHITLRFLSLQDLQCWRAVPTLQIMDPVCPSIWVNTKEGNYDDGPSQPYNELQIMPPQTSRVVLNRQHRLSTTIMDSPGTYGRLGRALRRHSWQRMITAAATFF